MGKVWKTAGGWTKCKKCKSLVSDAVLYNKNYLCIKCFKQELIKK